MGRRIVKKIEAHGHHGGAWKVAYADFVTAMMALFMCMWLIASTDAQARKEISNYFRTGILPDGSRTQNRAAQIKPSLVEVALQTPPPGQESHDDKEVVAEEIRKALAAISGGDAELSKVMKSISVKVDEEGVLIEAVDDENAMLFELSSAELKKPLEHFIETIAPLLSRFGKPVEINGHTDARPFSSGSRMSNWDLSYRRAFAAREILIANGVDDSMLQGVVARGASQLYVKDQPMAAKNRRLSFMIRFGKPPVKPQP